MKKRNENGGKGEWKSGRADEEGMNRKIYIEFHKNPTTRSTSQSSEMQGQLIRAGAKEANHH